MAGSKLLPPALAVALLVASACHADDPVDHPDDTDADLTADVLPPPKLDDGPATTPLSTVVARGKTEGARVVSVGATGTQLTAVLPGGTFCQDRRLSSGDNQIDFYAVGGDGRLSAATSLAVTKDAAAPEPTPASCSGGGVVCDAAETCDNDGLDDDCDGWADACDLACSGCVDDALEPNDVAVNVPTVEPGEYPLVLCPCRDDWFAFHVAEGDHISPSIAFTNDLIDIDLRLFHVESGGGGSGSGVQVADSTTTGDTESIDYTAPAAGTYYLRIFPYEQDQRPSGTYDLTIP